VSSSTKEMSCTIGCSCWSRAGFGPVSRDTIVPRQGRNAGKDVDVTRWTWYLEEAEEDVESLTGIDPTSEKSNLFGYLVALVGPDRESWLGLTPENLVGRKAMVNVIIQDGYPKVTAVTPLPKVKGKPVSPVVAPAAIVVGLVLETLKYFHIALAPMLEAKLEHEYFIFRHSALILLWSFAAALVVLAGAEWTARNGQVHSSDAGQKDPVS